MLLKWEICVSYKSICGKQLLNKAIRSDAGAVRHKIDVVTSP